MATDKRITKHDASCAGAGCDANVDPVMEGDLCAVCVDRVGAIRWSATHGTISADDAEWWQLTRLTVEDRQAHRAR